MKISLICPVYNGEKFLRACVDSVILQKHQDWELIAVNDGSTDCSEQILKGCAENDPRISFYSITNHGVAYARNYAITKAQGDYCFFLDCDDMLPDDSLEFLNSIAEQTDADMISGEPIHFTDTPEYCQTDVAIFEYSGEQEIYENVIFDIGELKPFKRKNEKRKINNGMWGCLYKTQLIKDNGVKFLGTKTGEDTYFSIMLLMHCRKVVMTSKRTYCFRVNPYSVTHKYINGYFDDVLECYTQFDKLYNEFPPDYIDKAKEGLKAWHYYRCRLAIEREITYCPGFKQMKLTLKRVARNEPFRKMYFDRKRLGIPESTTRWMKVTLFCVMHKMILLPILMSYLYHILRKIK